MHEYMAIGPNCWGRGDTEAKAVRNMRKNWAEVYAGRFRKKDRGTNWKVFIVPVGCWLDGIGSFCWDTAKVEHDPKGCDQCFQEVQPA